MSFTEIYSPIMIVEKSLRIRREINIYVIINAVSAGKLSLKKMMYIIDRVIWWGGTTMSKRLIVLRKL
jgi:hypothetical protein